eukprot:8969973-Heterocapsa_arctica.AAC.1
MRCDIRDTAGFLRKMKHMSGKEDNIYTIENVEGTVREHTIEVAGTIMESILGLGALHEQH